MIALDTSAIMAIILDEPDAAACIAVLEASDDIVICAATMAETLIVADRRNVGAQARRPIDGLGLEVASVTASTARHVAEAYGRWGKGVNGAGLNFGDRFAYAVARERDCPLLFVGDDFCRTDLVSAMMP